MRKNGLRIFVLAGLLIISLSLLMGIAVTAKGEDALTPSISIDLDTATLPAGLVEALSSAIQNREDSVSIREYGISMEKMQDVLDWVNDNAPMFCCSITKFQYNQEKDLVTGVTFTYNMTVEQYAQADAAAHAMVADLVSDAGLSDWQKALLVHDRLIASCAFDETTPPQPNPVYTVYGALVMKKAVCTGYTRTFNYLMSLLGIPARMVSSDSMNHAWNIITIGGKEYHVDVAWDDPIYELPGRVEHTYFLRSSAFMEANGHSAVDYDHTPSDTTFDDALWNSSGTAFQYLNGLFFYIDNSAATLCVWDGAVLNGGMPILSVDEYWMLDATHAYMGNYSKLVSDGTALYFNESKAVYRYVPGESEITLYYTSEKAKTEGFNIYGLAFRGDDLYLSVYDYPEIDPQDAEAALEKVVITPTYKQGDINGDNVISIMDVTQLLQKLASTEPLSSLGVLDVNKDGILSIMDVTTLLQIISKQS